MVSVMSSVHQILEAGGKDAALKAGIERPVVEAAASFMADEAWGIGTLYSGWCQAGLPHRRLADDVIWQISSDHITLLVEPAKRPDGRGGVISLGVPYGSRARLIMLYLQSEALRTRSRDVVLGSSLRDWLGRMNISIGGKTAKDVQEQAERIAGCRFSFHVMHGGTRSGFAQQSVVDTAMFAPAEAPGQHAQFVDVVRLSEVFFEQLQRHPVPVQEAAVRAISNNSVALDIYAWLAYRLHVLVKSTPISWPALMGQFGAGCARMNNWKPTFLANLKLALAVYPEARVDVEERGLLLHPSRPPVAPRIVAASG